MQPTSVNDATALEKAVLFADLTQDLANVYASPLSNAYPVSAYSYLVAPCNPTLAAAQKFNCTGPQGTSPFTADRGAELGHFINFMACAGQEKMASARLLATSSQPRAGGLQRHRPPERRTTTGRSDGGELPESLCRWRGPAARWHRT